MIAQVRAELLRQATVRTGTALFLTALALVVLAVVLHAIGLPIEMLQPQHNQLMVVGVGARLGVLFAALFGAIAVTTEFRHGTIRPALLAAPSRWRLIASKAIVAGFAGALFALGGTIVGAVAGVVLLGGRGVDLTLTWSDVQTLVAGGAVAGGLWAVIGVGVGAFVRNQVPALIGLSAWLLFIEGLLVEEASSVVEFGKYGPGAAATAISGMGGEALLTPGAALVVLSLYALVAVVVGGFVTQRRDVT
jgi:ABC-2 type transport system permease protein